MLASITSWAKAHHVRCTYSTSFLSLVLSSLLSFSFILESRHNIHIVLKCIYMHGGPTWRPRGSPTSSTTTKTEWATILASCSLLWDSCPSKGQDLGILSEIAPMSIVVNTGHAWAWGTTTLLYCCMFESLLHSRLHATTTVLYCTLQQRHESAI